MMLPLQVETWTWVVVHHGRLQRHCMVVHEWGRWTPLFKQMLSLKSWFTNEEGFSLLWVWASPWHRKRLPRRLIKVSRDWNRWLKLWWIQESLGAHSRPRLVWRRHQGHLDRGNHWTSEMRVYMNVLWLLCRNY